MFIKEIVLFKLTQKVLTFIFYILLTIVLKPPFVSISTPSATASRPVVTRTRAPASGISPPRARTPTASTAGAARPPAAPSLRGRRITRHGLHGRVSCHVTRLVAHLVLRLAAGRLSIHLLQLHRPGRHYEQINERKHNGRIKNDNVLAVHK